MERIDLCLNYNKKVQRGKVPKLSLGIKNSFPEHD